jgi:two-component system sensor histidine kinase RpfC
MDLNMPRLDGIETVRLFRVMALGTPHLPIIGLTADASAEAARRCRDAGMDGCLVKPLEPARLLAAVATLARPPRDAEPSADPVTAIAVHPRFRPAPPAAVDEEVLADLHALGGAAFVAELVEDFLVEAEDLLHQLVAAATEGDAGRFRADAHALQSSAANLGARALATLCSPWQLLGPDELRAQAAQFAARAGGELERTRRALLTRAAAGARQGRST